ncbi:toxin [Alcaligenes endophyticus]|uniref:Toxin n=1 Tax=Alcaligenes endophyticus TaxID=1929088 RepID=A0ABT8ELM4_9BURK|nr:toxin [Alcaligenes endophyticus]MCX5590636.1 toxin [Alcaligenes endophyticus]MDN4122000.1 toxin [Alcaligenes endophyticus]
MKAVFVKLPAFQRYRERYLDDVAYANFQRLLLHQPYAGDVMAATGGLRKVRFLHSRKGAGKRGGLRLIYYYWSQGDQFWLFTLYDKNEVEDLLISERMALARFLRHEIEART